MGLLWWWNGKKSESGTKAIDNSNTATKRPVGVTEVPGMNGAMELPRPPNFSVSVFEFGSVAASSDKVTLAGYCPVSEDLEPCRWEILPASASDAPQFRVVFG
ncbi:allyl alcohol dehydrogenase-like protein [Senna tora]|uniref:Allyl alcohol dehydrogenase-like protein n=1 Tax=Senna tora TaxID=362788 RepID=A0A834W5E9_9FABA|nr:allyl alcohol dehydrogenase-like protein [Senna tora]